MARFKYAAISSALSRRDERKIETLFPVVEIDGFSHAEIHEFLKILSHATGSTPWDMVAGVSSTLNLPRRCPLCWSMFESGHVARHVMALGAESIRSVLTVAAMQKSGAPGSTTFRTPESIAAYALSCVFDLDFRSRSADVIKFWNSHLKVGK